MAPLSHLLAVLGLSATPSLARRPREPLAMASRAEPLERRWLDLRALLEDMPASCGASLRAAGIALEHRLPEVALGVWADPRELKLTLGHIVRLACDAMPRGGVLKTFARRENDQAVVSFMDSSLASGRQPMLATLYQRLFIARAVPIAKDEEVLREGALCSRRIVDALGGRLYAAPSALGGMGLTLRMPLVQAREGVGARPGLAP
ncbi:HAMP domain-containing sensor histidine kinase [Variovorax sp. KK3]|uniref:sensor histidine kinase n=1 Tax=Variovorax sp. KK3 TaxID=1855728 RepID=UPI00117EDAFC|nr:hypothetical protein [Variovorax sp. KK3]